MNCNSSSDSIPLEVSPVKQLYPFEITLKIPKLHIELKLTELAIEMFFSFSNKLIIELLNEF